MARNNLIIDTKKVDDNNDKNSNIAVKLPEWNLEPKNSNIIRIKRHG